MSPRLYLILIVLTGLLASSCDEPKSETVTDTASQQDTAADTTVDVEADTAADTTPLPDLPVDQEPDVVIPDVLKILVVLDQSSSMQCSDSPNRRFDYLNALIAQYDGNPNVEFAGIGFGAGINTYAFGAISPLLQPAALAPASDYQGALAKAIELLEADMLSLTEGERAHTTYEVLFHSDGTPSPRCDGGCEDDTTTCTDTLDNDGDNIIDSADMDCDDTLPDDLYGVCNTTENIPDDIYVDMQGTCPEYNSETQILSHIAAIEALQRTYDVADVTVNTYLVFGPTDEVESTCPGIMGEWEPAALLLQTMASAGGGTFTDYVVDRTPGQPQVPTDAPYECDDRFGTCGTP